MELAQENVSRTAAVPSRWSRILEKASSRKLLISISIIYFGITIPLASIKLLWLDEFITFYIAELGSVTGIWNALRQGADPNPPLIDLLVLLSSRLFGQSALALRVPAILASWVGVVALFFFLRKRVSPAFAAGGALFFMATPAFDYSYESRSYALLLCFSALSLVAWRSSIESRRPILGAAGLALSLAAGIFANYFAVLAFFPIAAGELVRDIRLRKIEWQVWIALAIAGSTLLLYLPLINKAVATFSPYAWNKVESGAISDSYLEMIEFILWLALGIMLAGICIRRFDKSLLGPPVLPLHEAVCAFFLMLYPFLGYGVARIRGGMLSPRFVIPMAYGFAIAAVVTAFRLFRERPGFSLAFLCLLFAWVFAREGVVAKMYYDQRLALYRIYYTLPPATTLVVPDSLLVLPLHHYAPPEVASRIVFPVDFPAIRKYKNEDSPEQNLWNGRNGIFPVPIMSLADFRASNSHFLIAAPVNNWLIRKLSADHTPPLLLPVFTDTKDIQGFTPLCHGPVWFFEAGREQTSSSNNSAENDLHEESKQ
jgi:hypothetical protein